MRSCVLLIPYFFLLPYSRLFFIRRIVPQPLQNFTQLKRRSHSYERSSLKEHHCPWMRALNLNLNCKIDSPYFTQTNRNYVLLVFRTNNVSIISNLEFRMVILNRFEKADFISPLFYPLPQFLRFVNIIFKNWRKKIINLPFDSLIYYIL